MSLDEVRQVIAAQVRRPSDVDEHAELDAFAERLREAMREQGAEPPRGRHWWDRWRRRN